MILFMHFVPGTLALRRTVATVRMAKKALIQSLQDFKNNAM